MGDYFGVAISLDARYVAAHKKDQLYLLDTTTNATVALGYGFVTSDATAYWNSDSSLLAYRRPGPSPQALDTVVVFNPVTGSNVSLGQAHEFRWLYQPFEFVLRLEETWYRGDVRAPQELRVIADRPRSGIELALAGDWVLWFHGDEQQFSLQRLGSDDHLFIDDYYDRRFFPSPDQQHLAWPGTRGIYVFHTRTGQIEKVWDAPAISIEQDQADVSNIVWSPQQQQIGFKHYDRAESLQYAVIYDLAKRQTVARVPANGEPGILSAYSTTGWMAWSPDETAVAFFVLESLIILDLQTGTTAMYPLPRVYFQQIRWSPLQGASRVIDRTRSQVSH